ncbi:MAG: prolipoprotein diacylglyceryl transferase, partial [Desulfobacteraceae bacterium]
AIGMFFPNAPGAALRHPTQLYEAFFEGIVLFIVLWNLRKLKTPKGAMLSFYIIGYGLVRFFIEFYRQPDSHIGFVFMSLSMGQLLCGLMMICGAVLYLVLYRMEKQRAGLLKA